MERKIKQILFVAGYALSYIWPKSISSNLQAIRTHLYTGYHARRFKKWGKGSLLSYRANKILGFQHITVGENTEFGKNIRLTAWEVSPTKRPEIRIGDNCKIGEGSHLTAMNSIVIGNGLLTGMNVLITDNAHGDSMAEQLSQPPLLRPLCSKGGVIIGDNVWIGNNVCILPGVTIGDGAIIGANSSVTKDIPAYSIAVGSPATIVKRLTEEKSQEKKQ